MSKHNLISLVSEKIAKAEVIPTNSGFAVFSSPAEFKGDVSKSEFIGMFSSSEEAVLNVFDKVSSEAYALAKDLTDSVDAYEMAMKLGTLARLESKEKLESEGAWFPYEFEVNELEAIA